MRTPEFIFVTNGLIALSVLCLALAAGRWIMAGMWTTPNRSFIGVAVAALPGAIGAAGRLIGWFLE